MLYGAFVVQSEEIVKECRFSNKQKGPEFCVWTVKRKGRCCESPFVLRGGSLDIQQELDKCGLRVINVLCWFHICRHIWIHGYFSVLGCFLR